MDVSKFDIDVATQLAVSAGLLARIPVEQLRAHVQECRSSVDRAESLGPILDPTAYRESLHDGSLQDAKHQLAIAEGLLKVRELIDKRNAFAASMEAKKQARKQP